MFEKNISSIQEIKARDGKVITISDKDIHNADRNIQLPSTIDEIYPFLTTVVGQLLAYHVADILEKDIDKPRNLAKSVTVK
jgi:glucosamine--fructose-6-phosphate aminotransferase (isomerizing)